MFLPRVLRKNAQYIFITQSINLILKANS